MQEIYLFIDDSGSLHKNAPDDFFIYAGYIFINKKIKEDAKRKYKILNKKLCKSLHRNDELKACNLSKNNKRALYNVMRNYKSFDVRVYIPYVYEKQKTDKKTIVRFKDYILKRIIKEVFKDLIDKKEVDPYLDTNIIINIDEQLTSTNGFYSLDQSILEEFTTGIENFNYGNWSIKPIWFGNLNVMVDYCDSSHNYLIQASDILANRIFNSFRQNKPNMRNIPNHIFLEQPKKFDF